MENIKKMNTTWIGFGKVMENEYHLNCVLYKLVEVNTILICTGNEENLKSMKSFGNFIFEKLRSN